MNDFKITARGAKMLLRLTALFFSGIAVAMSTYIPLWLFFDIPTQTMLYIFIILAVGIFLIQGILTHAYNDLADFQSGTDQLSPAMLSGGSRVLIEEQMSLTALRYIAIVTTFIVAFLFILAVGTESYRLAFLIAIGWFTAYSYSVKPFSFAYRPFIAEVFSLFPSIFFLTIAAPWLAFGEIPLWAVQNGIVNALWFIAWIQVSAIQDIYSDQQATPKKRTTAVYMTERFGIDKSIYAPLLYFSLIVPVAIWILVTRPIAGLLLFAFLAIAIYLVVQMNARDNHDVARRLALLLIGAGVVAVTLGLFIAH